MQDPDLKSDLITFTRANRPPPCHEFLQEQLSSNLATEPSSPELLVQVQAAADFYSSDKKRMTNPPPVTIDISSFTESSHHHCPANGNTVLDPYILNLLPASLLPTGLYLILTFIAAFYLGTTIFTWLNTIANNPRTTHPIKPKQS